MNESFTVVFILLAQTIHGEQSVSFVDFSDNRIMGLERGGSIYIREDLPQFLVEFAINHELCHKFRNTDFDSDVVAAMLEEPTCYWYGAWDSLMYDLEFR